jgi:hypothetical protein
MMSKIIATLSLLLFGFSHALAEDITIKNPIKHESFIDVINAFIDYVFLLGMAVSPVFFLLAAFYFLAHGGNEKNIAKAKNIIKYTLIGIVILLLSKGLVNFTVDVFKTQEDCSVIEAGESCGGGVVVSEENGYTLIVTPEDSNEKKSWDSAESYCESYIHDGYSDWYLPTKDNLKVICDEEVITFQDGTYWSSTANPPNDDTFQFINNDCDFISDHRDEEKFVYCVRQNKNKN